MDCCVRGRPFAHSALSCSIDALLVFRVRAGAVEGRLCVSVFSLTERLGRKGRESFLVNRDGVRGGEGSVVVIPGCPSRALHDLARLRTRGMMLSRLEGLRRRDSVWRCSTMRVSSRFREAGRDFGLDNGSRGSGFSEMGRRPGVPGPGLLAKSLCRTDMVREGALFGVLTRERCTQVSNQV